MKWIFRKAASTSEKLFVSFFYCLCVTLVYGMGMSSFYPAQGTRNISFALAAPLCTLLIVPLLRDKQIKAKIKSVESFKGFSFCVSVTIICFGFSFMVLNAAVPSIYTRAFGVGAMVIVKVEQKEQRGRKGCGKWLYLNPPLGNSTKDICVDDHTWRKTNTGDSLKVYLRVSPVGMLITQLEP